MMKLFKKYAWISLIILQAFLGIGAGMLCLSSIKVDAVTANTKVGQLSVGDLSFKEAEALLTDYYRQQTETATLVIEIDQKATKIAYSDLDISVDIDKTIENLKISVPQNALSQFFSNSGKEISIQPVFSYNSGKFLAKCEALFSPYETVAIPEHYSVEDGLLKLIPQTPGRVMDYVRLEQEIKAMFFVANAAPYRVDTQTSALFAEAPAKSLYKEPFTTLITQAHIPLDSGLLEKIDQDIKALNGLIFEKGQDIDLKALIDFSRYQSDVEKDLLNRIATALYQAALPIDGVNVFNRKASQRIITYTEPGLEAVIEGEGANLLMKNGTERPLMLLVNGTDDQISFYMASTGELKSGILIVQKRDEVPPPVITSVNKALAPSITKVISQGTPGFTVYVSRLIDDDRKELYKDKYQPISKIVEVGEKPILTGSK